MRTEPVKTECGKYTLLVGLVKVGEDYVSDANKTGDLTAIKERVMHKVLNINNYIKSLCDYYDREKKSAQNEQKTNTPDINTAIQNTAMNLERFVSRDEFFVYSVCVTFNPRIQTINDLLKDNREGDGVCTITVKLPKDKQRQTFYIRLMLKLISKHSLMLKLTPETTTTLEKNAKTSDETVTPTHANQAQGQKGSESLPGYFDDGPKDDKMVTQGQQYVKAGMNSIGSYSFFNQSSMVLSKYVSSNLVLHDDDRIVAERLRREKEKKKKGTRL